MRHGSNEIRQSTAKNLADLIKQVCAQRDSEAQSILTAYYRLDSNLGLAVANELGLVPKDIMEHMSRESLKEVQREFEAKDATGEDYELDFNQDDGGRKAA